MKFLKIATLLATFYLFSGLTPAKKYNLLFIIVDDLRPELNCYGKNHISSPNIDKLAASGLQFSEAYCNIPVCGASRASLLTGKRPTRNRFLDYDTYAQKEVPGIIDWPGLLKNNGYTTIRNGKVNHHIEDNAQSWSQIWIPNVPKYWINHVLPENQKYGDELTERGVPFEAADVHDTTYVDGKIAVKSINDLKHFEKTGKPFLLAVGFFKPHLPFNCPKKYWDMYDTSKITLPETYLGTQDAPRAAYNTFGELRGYANIPKSGQVPDAMAKKLIHGYRACVSYTDANIGRVIDQLQKSKLKENTYVILTADHGFNLGDHGLWCKHSNWKSALQVPLIIAGPGIKGGQKTANISELVDLYPTICDLLNLQKPSHLEGSSLKTSIENPEIKTKDIAISKWYDGVSIKAGAYLYTQWQKSDTNIYAQMLYNNILDPLETKNISQEKGNKSLIDSLSTLIKTYRGKDFFQMPEKE